MSSLLPIELVTKKILIIRGTKVLLDRDLALLYGVKPIALRQQVKRNIGRFPKDFMFQLTLEEADYLVSQNVIPSKRSYGGSLQRAFDVIENILEPKTKENKNRKMGFHKPEK